MEGGLFFHALHDELVHQWVFAQGIVDFRVASLNVGSDVDQVFGFAVGCLGAAEDLTQFKLPFRDHINHHPACRSENIDSGIGAFGGEIAAEDDMSVDDGADRIRDRVVHVITLDKHGVETRD